MAESSSRVPRSSKVPLEQLFQETKFGTIVRALWPNKPALQLAQRLGISERNALQIMRGERKVTAHAVHVINSEMLD